MALKINQHQRKIAMYAPSIEQSDTHRYDGLQRTTAPIDFNAPFSR